MTTEDLSPRERQILRLIGEGKATKDIARALRISVWTVASHRKRICSKLGVHSAAELVAWSAAQPSAKNPGVEPMGTSCRLSLNVSTGGGRLRLTYNGRLRPSGGIATLQIGSKVYRF